MRSIFATIIISLVLTNSYCSRSTAKTDIDKLVMLNQIITQIRATFKANCSNLIGSPAPGATTTTRTNNGLALALGGGSDRSAHTIYGLENNPDKQDQLAEIVNRSSH
jgi:hypothetical protein